MSQEDMLKKIIDDIQQQDKNIEILNIVNLICDSHIRNCKDCKYATIDGCMFNGKNVDELREILCLK